MWYKEQTDGTWITANKVTIPNNPSAPIILEFNHNAKVQGWAWSDDPPQEYLDWQASLLNEEIIMPTENNMRTMHTVVETKIVSTKDKKLITKESQKSLSLWKRVKRFFYNLFK